MHWCHLLAHAVVCDPFSHEINDWEKPLVKFMLVWVLIHVISEVTKFCIFVDAD